MVHKMLAIVMLCVPLVNVLAKPQASAPRTTMWVTPATDLDLCANRTGPCKTLTQYRDENMLNRSNVDWRFLSGPTPHVLSGGLYVFSKVTNVSLECENDINSRKCLLICTISEDKLCIFLFVNASNIRMAKFTIAYNGSYTAHIQTQHLLKYIDPGMVNSKNKCVNQNKCYFLGSITTNRTWIFTDSVNITVFGVDFIGPQNSWAVVRPRGKFTISNCSFTKLSSGLSEYDPLNTSTGQHHITIILETTKSWTKPSRFSSRVYVNFTIQYTSFHGISYLPRKPFRGRNYPVIYVRSRYPLRGWRASFTTRDCGFRKCPAIEVKALEDHGLTVKIEKNQIFGEVNKTFATKWLHKYKHCVFNASSIHLEFVNHQGKSCSIPQYNSRYKIISIFGNNFTDLASGQGSAISMYSRRIDNCSVAVISVSMNLFQSNYGLHYRSVVFASDRIVGTSKNKRRQYSFDDVQFRLVLSSNTFRRNFYEARTDHRCIVFSRDISNYIIEKQNSRAAKGHNYVQSCYWQAVVHLNGFQQNRRVLLDDNTIENNHEAGLKLEYSVAQLRRTNVIQLCSTHYGAGIRMIGNSHILLEDCSLLNLSRNRAYVRAGAFYIQDHECMVKRQPPKMCACFFQLVDRNGTIKEQSSIRDLKEMVELTQNTAGDGRNGTASMFFNSNIDQCTLWTNFTSDMEFDIPANRSEMNMRILQKAFNLSIPEQNFDSSKISSIPRKMCICSKNGKMGTCDLNNLPPLMYYPGQRLKISIFILGDMNIPLNNVLYIDMEREKYRNSNYVNIPLNVHSTHILESKCNSITLPPLPRPPRNTSWLLQLRVPVFRDTIIQEKETTYLHSFMATKAIGSCPDGFYQKNKGEYKCKCQTILQKHDIQCLLDQPAFIRPRKSPIFWIGKDIAYPNASTLSSIVWSFQCPQVLCNINESTKHNFIPIDNYDIQCKYGRTGVLCGQCPAGLSAIVFSNSCAKCTHWSLLLLLVVLIGIPLLVFLIGALNMTITVGTINGFMFYITIIVINGDNLPLIHSGNLVYICFYDGMDMFGKTLFSYLFALYLLVLVGIACFLPKCKLIKMHKVNKLIGSRITPVLATIITFSYLIIASSTIQTLLYASLYRNDGNIRTVWLFDGSLEYFQSPKHIILGCMAIAMLLFFLLPAAFIATFGDLLRRFIKGPYYVNFLDTFHGAFQFRFGFWLGIQLVLLTVIMVLKIIAGTQHAYIAIVCMSTLMVLFQMIIQPYKGMRVKHCVSEAIKKKYFSKENRRSIANIFDNLYHFNLILLFACILYLPRKPNVPLAISQIAAYTKLAIVLIYHLLEYTPLGQFLIAKMRRVHKMWNEKKRLKAAAQLRNDSSLVDHELTEYWEANDINQDSFTGGSSTEESPVDPRPATQTGWGSQASYSVPGSDNVAVPWYRTEYDIPVQRKSAYRIQRNSDSELPTTVPLLV